MKKSLFIIAATALVISCSNNDVKNDILESNIEIGFSAATYKTTRAEITSNANLATEGGFVVWGYKAKNQETMNWATEAYTVFNGVNVHVKSGQDGAYITGTETDWTYDTKKYWDKNASYCFYAVAPFNPSNSAAYQISDAANNAKRITITNAKSGLASESDDFLIARGGIKDRKGTNQANVDFTFNHTMAKVDFKLKKGDNIDGTVKVQSITMTGWNSNDGTFTESLDATPNVATNVAEWSITGTGAGSATVLNEESAALTTSASATTTKTFIMVPQAIAANTLTFTIDYTVGDEHFYAQVGKVADAQVWGTDSHITYTLTIAPAAIEFDVTTLAGFTNTGTGETTVQ